MNHYYVLRQADETSRIRRQIVSVWSLTVCRHRNFLSCSSRLLLLSPGPHNDLIRDSVVAEGPRNSPPGLSPRTIAWTVSFELLRFCFYFSLFFRF